MRKRLLHQPIDILSFNEAIARIKSSFLNKTQLKIITFNPEMIIEADKNFEFQAAINNSDLIVPDGVGIVWALKKLQIEENISRIPGIELGKKALALANELNKKVCLYGGSQEVLDACIKNLKSIFPNIDFRACFNGYENDQEKIVEALSKENPNLVLVALGSPRQELWINKCSSYFPQSTLIGVGGSFDIWSGLKKRAPGWMIDMHVEWLYRITSEPHRISRVLKSHPKFIKMVFDEFKNLNLHTK